METVKVTSGGHEFELSELTAKELRKVTSMIPADELSDAVLSQVVAIAAVRVLDGSPVTPVAGGLPFDTVEAVLRGRDVMALMNAYNKAYPQEAGEQLKKE